jgi:hypothetical protein
VGGSGIVVENTLVIDSNTSLVSLTGLQSNTYIPEIEITNNEALENLTGLQNLTAVDILTITGNPNLVSLAALAGVEQGIEWYDVTNNVSLPYCELCSTAAQFVDEPTYTDVTGNVADVCGSATVTDPVNLACP